MSLFPAPRIIALLVLLLRAGPLLADPTHSPILPDPAMTSSDVLTTDAAAICVPGYTRRCGRAAEREMNRPGFTGDSKP